MGTFEKMKSILQREYDRLHDKGGQPAEAVSRGQADGNAQIPMESIGADYGVSRSTVCETIQWVEDTLAKDKAFKLPGKRILKKGEDEIQYIVASD
jgi:hypothetical protein